ncbi:MAG: methyltransferase domain-containing protein [Gemmatimonadetes bacterium]|nr:methyltransferase domain-containing protein [Gemmatimonadota bacterium]
MAFTADATRSGSRWVLGTAVAIILISATIILGQPAHDDAGQAWNRRYEREMYVYGKEPVDFLPLVIDRLPRGRALVLAAGEGRNAVYLAQQGFDVTAVDVSSTGLQKCLTLAAERQVSVQTIVADLDTFDLGTERWDLITNFYYHDSALYERIMAALTPGGFFALQNFALDQLTTHRFGPRSPDWLVSPNALTKAFADWRIRHYEDRIVELNEGMHRGPGAIVRLLVEKAVVVPLAPGD